MVKMYTREVLILSGQRIPLYISLSHFLTFNMILEGENVDAELFHDVGNNNEREIAS